jgi:hypothetical protein
MAMSAENAMGKPKLRGVSDQGYFSGLERRACDLHKISERTKPWEASLEPQSARTYFNDATYAPSPRHVDAIGLIDTSIESLAERDRVLLCYT